MHVCMYIGQRGSAAPYKPSAYVAYVSIRQHTSAQRRRNRLHRDPILHTSAYVSVCRSAYTENEIPIIRHHILHTSAYADYIRQRMPMPARQRGSSAPQKPLPGP